MIWWLFLLFIIFFSLAESPWSCRLGNLDLSILLRSRVFYFLEISLFSDLACCNFSYSRLADEITVGLGPTGMTISYYLWIGIILLFFKNPPIEYLRHSTLLLSGCWRGLCWLLDFVSGLACLAWLYMELWFETSVWTQGFVLFFSKISPQRKYWAFLRTDKLLTLLVDGHPWRADNRKVYP